MARQIVVFAVVVTFIVGGSLARKLPDFVKTCQRNTKDSDKCFADAITDVMPHIKDGVPAMGIPLLEPIHLPSLYVDSGSGGSFAFDINGTDVEFYGISSLKVQKAKMDVENNILTLELLVPTLNVSGHYRSKGKLLIIAIDGEGEMFFSYRNLRLNGEWEGTRTMRKGNEYYSFKEKKFSITVEKGSYGNFGNLFKNSPELTESTNKVFNENFEIAFAEFKPTIDIALSRLTTAVINNVHERFSIDTLYPV